MPIIDPYKQKFGSTGGWICSTCGQWVPNGVLHQCQGKEYGEVRLDLRTTDMKVKALEYRVTLLERLVDNLIGRIIGE